MFKNNDENVPFNRIVRDSLREIRQDTQRTLCETLIISFIKIQLKNRPIKQRLKNSSLTSFE